MNPHDVANRFAKRFAILVLETINDAIKSWLEVIDDTQQGGGMVRALRVVTALGLMASRLVERVKSFFWHDKWTKKLICNEFLPGSDPDKFRIAQPKYFLEGKKDQMNKRKTTGNFARRCLLECWWE